MNIKELRTKEGLSQSALAKKLGIATSAIGHMENGRMKVSAKIADLVREAFGVELEVPEKKARQGKTEKTTKKQAAKRGTRGQSKKPARKKKAAVSIVYQSAQGNEITEAEILAKVGEADHIYVRMDENKAYWVRGEESGSVELW